MGSGDYGRPATAAALALGSIVYVTTLRQKGTVQQVSGEEVTVQLGIMKINVPIENCRLIDSITLKEKKIA